MAIDVAAADVAAPRRPVWVPVAGRAVRTAAWYALLTVLACAVLFPLYLTFVRALSNPAAFAAANSPLHPVKASWSSFSQAFQRGNLGRAFVVSAVVCVVTVALQLITSAMAAYAFVFLRFPFKRFLFAVSIASLFLPMEVTLLANVSMVRQLHWVNTYQGLVVPYAATGLGIFLLRQGFAGVPVELRDAARLDGYGHLRFITTVVLPLSRPIVASFALISAITVWGNYLWPRLIVTDTSHQTLPLALAILTGEGPDRANVSTAGVLLAVAPLVVLLVAFQRHVVRGLTAGAVKG